MMDTIRLGRMACRVVVLWGLFAGTPSGADPLADYLQACEAWNTRDASRATCSALVERLSVLDSPEPLERLALFKARVWLGDLTNAPYRTYCDGVRAIIEYLPDHPDVLVDAVACFDLKQRRYPEQAASLLARALEVDPGHRGALEMLARKVWIKGDDLGVDAATLDRHRRTLYEIAEDDNGKIAAAGYIHAAAVGRSDPNAAAAIREKVRRDLAFDTLDYDTEHRADSLQRTCGDDRLYDLDLEALCLDALVSLARSAADAGDAIPDNVLDRIGDVLDRLRVPHAVGGFRYRSWRTGPKTGAVARLKAVLDAHPEPLRSSEHYRAHARTAADWAARIGALRRAVDLDSGNFAAQCDLADALAWTGERDEARSFYKNVDEATVPPCDFESALVTLDELDRQDEMLLRVTPPR